MSQVTDEVEDLLRSSRPDPRPEFVGQLEERLLAGARRRRPAATVRGLAVAAALTVVLVVLGVTGTLPLRLGGDQPATATKRCTTVLVDRTVRRPVFDVTRAGELRVRYRNEIVRSAVKRCR